MGDTVWETFDGLFKTLHRQGRRVEELERRLAALEQRLEMRARMGRPVHHALTGPDGAYATLCETKREGDLLTPIPEEVDCPRCRLALLDSALDEARPGVFVHRREPPKPLPEGDPDAVLLTPPVRREKVGAFDV